MGKTPPAERHLQPHASLHSHLILRKVWDNVFFLDKECLLRAGWWQTAMWAFLHRRLTVSLSRQPSPRLLSYSLPLASNLLGRDRRNIYSGVHLTSVSSSYKPLKQRGNFQVTGPVPDSLELRLLMSSSRTESGKPLWQNFQLPVDGWWPWKTISSGFWQVSLSFPATPDVLQVPSRSSTGLQGSVIIVYVRASSALIS